MNGKKVLDQLINLFIVINIVLFVVNCLNRGNEYILSQERIDNITKLLEQEGISIEAELIKDYSPKYTANLLFAGSSVAVREEVVKNFFGTHFSSVKRSTATSDQSQGRNIFYYTYGEETLAFDHNEMTYINQESSMIESRPSLETAKGMCTQFIKRMDANKQGLAYSITEEAYDTYWKLTYYPIIKEIPILDSYMEFIVSSSGVIKVNMCLAEVEIQSNSKQDIYAMDLVLFEIQDYMQENGYTNIEKIELCYKCAENEENVLGQQIIPMYKIQISGLEEAIFVNAYNNKKL